MIVALGTGLIDRARFVAARRRFGDRLLDRLFTDGERRYARARGPRENESLAVRLAAKIAVGRALGAHWPRWRELSVEREPGRAPRLVARGASERELTRRGVTRIHLSLGHDGGLCVGQVLLEDRTPLGGSAGAPATDASEAPDDR